MGVYVPEDWFYLKVTSIVDPDEIWHSMESLLGLHCMSVYPMGVQLSSEWKNHIKLPF